VALTEFDIIRQFFMSDCFAADHPHLVKGPGDDAAILSLPDDHDLLVSVDTLNESVHFLPEAEPSLLAARCLAVNVSDLAAMGASPLGFTLALSLPQVNNSWLQAFSEGLAQAARDADCPLIGGDTTRGPLSITIQVHGMVPKGQALLRSGASAGDAVYVTGTLGDAAAALWWMQGDPRFSAKELSSSEEQYLLEAFYRPASRIPVGKALRGIASAALDLSDGLASDLQHILKASCVSGARIEARQLPVSDVLKQRVSRSDQIELAMGGGDDYELCVCIPPARITEAEMAVAALQVPFTRIGQLSNDPEMMVIASDGSTMDLKATGYHHFQSHSS
jgi:thiamine-monophosphate kinase